MKREINIQCKICGDLIDTSHNPKNCYKCNTPLLSYIPEKNQPWYSQEYAAFLIAATVGVILLFVMIGVVDTRFGFCLGPIVLTLMYSLCPRVYKILVSKGNP